MVIGSKMALPSVSFVRISKITSGVCPSASEYIQKYLFQNESLSVAGSTFDRFYAERSQPHVASCVSCRFAARMFALWLLCTQF